MGVINGIFYLLIMDKKTLAIFDFDGTITDKDSMYLFLKYIKPKSYITNVIKALPTIMFFFLGIYSRKNAKEALLSQFLKDMPFNLFQQKCNSFAEEILPQIIRPSAIEKIKWHQTQEHHIVIISASPENWLIPWCKQFDIDLIATQMEIVNDCLTGKIDGKNCRGAQKVALLKKYFPHEKFEYKYGYGNSNGDKALLSIVKKSYFKPFE